MNRFARMLLGALCVGILSSAAWAAREEEDPIARGVVRIYAYARRPNTYQPWQMLEEEASSGSGALIEGGRILTNAHVVSDQVYLQVRRAGDPRKYAAKVEFVAHDGELALLRVSDPAFYQGAKPIAMGGLPRQRDRLTVYGFPVGGEDLSVTQGIVSRIEVTDYAHTGRGLLTVQTDAAINPGNSGGPAVMDGKLVGVAFQVSEEAQNVGYIIPVPLIRRFLRDIEDGRYDGIPDLGISWQPLENPSFREFCGLKPSESGIRVSTVVYNSSAWGALRTGDVVTAIGGAGLADDGSAETPGAGRLQFQHQVSLYQVGQRVELSVVRDGRRVVVPVTLKPISELVKGPFYDVKPSYFVFAGLVFTPLTRNYIDNWDYREVPTHLKYYLEYGLPTAERKEVVILGHVLPHDINAGYQDYNGVVLESVNGRPVSSLKDVVEGLKSPKGRYHVIVFDRETDGGILVLDAEAARKANAEILAKYGLPSDRSDDLK
ncbi:MAG TPA: serine protease [Elusimicrobiota bacterium]|nr:serine protease [Elusimicrobiota bacterium]